MTIDRSSPVPYYHQLRGILEARIDGGDLKAGEQLPGELALCESYGVSRTVVRQALSDMEANGHIVRRKGKGTFVAEPKLQHGLVQTLGGLSEDLGARGRDLYSRVVRLESAPAPAGVGEMLGVGSGGEVVTLERIRYVDGDPWVVTTSFLPVGVAEPLLSMDMSRRSLYRTLEQDFGLRLHRAQRTVEAVRAGETLARYLDIAEGSAVLLLKSLTHLADGRPVEYFVAWHRGDRSRFDVTLENRTPAMMPPSIVLADIADGGYPAVLPGDHATRKALT